MDDVATPIPFGERLRSLLEGRTPRRTQAWLADQSGLDRSLISRIVKGDRVPTDEALLSIAPALAMDVADLVRGTTAERSFEGTRPVKQEDFALALQKMVEYEGRARELESQLRVTREMLSREEKRRSKAEEDAFSAHHESELAVRELASARAHIHLQEKQLRSYHEGLRKAVDELNVIRQKLKTVSEELISTKTSGRLAALLSGIAAFTGVVTLASFLGTTDDESDSSEQKPQGTARQRRNR